MSFIVGEIEPLHYFLNILPKIKQHIKNPSQIIEFIQSPGTKNKLIINKDQNEFFLNLNFCHFCFRRHSLYPGRMVACSR